MKRARTCHGPEPLRGGRCPDRGQAGQAAIDSLGVLTLVVLIVGVVMVSTTQVAANVQAQLLCAVDSIGTEGGETSCGEPADGTGPEDEEGIVDPPSFAAQQAYYVTTEDGTVHQMELGGGQGDQLDRSLGSTGNNQFDPSLDGVNEEESACRAENE